ncbi:retrovirus-related pol polyprotein from transposon tnt 1-94, partial [Nicotiana attenuata]
ENIAQPSQLISFNPASQLPLKLQGSSNYCTWKSQVITLLFGYDLLGYVDGSLPSPSVHIQDGANNAFSNPAFKLWQRQDSLVRNAIMASVDPTIASLIAHAATAKHAWEILQTTYANKSQSRIFSLRDTLANLKRDSRSISEYMKDIKSISDDLASSGSPLANEELVIKILSGLGSEYKKLSAAIRARDNTISFEELYDKLLAHEMFIKHSEPKLENPIITAHLPKQKSRNYNPSNDRMGPIQNTSTNQRTNSFQNSNSFHPNNRSNQQRVQCQLCDKFEHIAKVCRSKSHSALEGQANFTNRLSYASNPTNNWIVDSGASHHITNNSQSLQATTEFPGTDEIIVGEGKTIPITHIGHTTLSSSHNSFKLRNVLYSPYTKKKLISVAQFCRQNITSIEFFPYSFLVKDL